MNDKQIIEQLFSEGRLQEAIDKLSQLISARPESDQWYFMRGKAYWKAGDKRRAINDYEHAVQLNPSSPAAAALEMSRSIMDFFNPDLLNP